VLTPPVWQLAGIDLEPGLGRAARAAVTSTAAGSYVKVVLRLDPDRLRLWERDGAHPFPLLTDGPAGCIYLTDGRPHGRAHVLTMLIPAGAARALTGRAHPEIVTRAVAALSRLTDGAVQAGLRMATQIAARYRADVGAKASIMARTSSPSG
jgi:monoamine oxidase